MYTRTFGGRVVTPFVSSACAHFNLDLVDGACSGEETGS